MLGGAFVFVNDCLLLAGLVKPAGDGPFGLIAGPILVPIGSVLLVWLWNSRPMLD